MTADPSRFATPRVAAGVLFADDADRVLMLRTTYKEAWEIPGGYIDRGELPREACARELAEELRLTRPVGRLLAIDWAPHPDEGDKLLLIFDGGHLADDQVATLQFPDGEVAAAAYVPADELDRVTVPRLARRIRAALKARHSGQTVYLERGVVPGP